LIEDLLKLSRIIRSDMQVAQVDLSQIASAIVQDLKQTQPNRQVEVTIQANLTACGDARLLRVALENLLGNAWKYTSRQAIAEIEFGIMPKAPIFFVRDNGVGFDMAQSGRLFNAFQRLHAYEDFPGNGIGLMTVRRIIQRHQGQIWVDSETDRGTTFYFTTLPPNS
jgi:light-regulated signal transduction histidine kinase (bacteriophytochrome)